MDIGDLIVAFDSPDQTRIIGVGYILRKYEIKDYISMAPRVFLDVKWVKNNFYSKTISKKAIEHFLQTKEFKLLPKHKK